jgi:hypothetical protein
MGVVKKIYCLMFLSCVNRSACNELSFFFNKIYSLLVIFVKKKGAGTDLLKGNLESASPTLLYPGLPKPF